MDESHGLLPCKKQQQKKQNCRSSEITQAKTCLNDKIMEQEYFILNCLIQSYTYMIEYIYGTKEIEADVYLI